MIGGALAQESVVRIDANSKEGSLDVPLDDRQENRQEKFEQRAVPGISEVPIDRVKEPKRCVGGVVDPGVVALREHVRNETVLHIVRKGSEDVARLGIAAGDESQALEADHGVATPVGEPVVARNDRAKLVAVCVRTRCVGDSSCRVDDELIGGEDELTSKAFPDGATRGGDEPRPPARFELEDFVRGEGRGNVPRFGRCGESGSRTDAEDDSEESGRILVTDGVVTATLLDSVVNVSYFLAL
jgi:hypothetical protein